VSTKNISSELSESSQTLAYNQFLKLPYLETNPRDSIVECAQTLLLATVEGFM
jgi:hypothetical protein